MTKILTIILSTLFFNMYAVELDYVSIATNSNANIVINDSSNSIERVFYNYNSNSNESLKLIYQTILIQNNSDEEQNVRILPKNENSGIITDDIVKKGYTTEQLVDFYILKKHTMNPEYSIKPRTSKKIQFVVLKIKE